jgi:hypothetical protein
MKKLFISVGLAAAGTVSLQADYAPDLNSMQTTKIWSASASLRGFYDDNYNTAHDKQGSAGFEVSPSLQLSVPLQQTEIGLKYTYGLYYYQTRQNQGNDPVDQSHQVDLWLDHAFTERFQGTVKDTFRYGREPSLLNPNGGPQSFSRINGNNIANYANASLTSDWTREFSTVSTYNNSFYNFQNSGTTVANLSTQGASQAGLLDRIDQSIANDFRWSVSQQTIVLIGYAFGWVDYTAGEPIQQSATTTFYSNDRNYRSHTGYVGFQSTVLPNLNASVKVGVEDDQYYRQSYSQLGPYLVSTASYTYAPGSYVQVGIQHNQNASDIAALGSNGRPTLSEESTVFSASLNHQITAKLLGSLVGSVQDSTYNQGAYNNNSDWIYSLGANLSYAFNQHFSTEVGYNFDDLQSNVPNNSFSRNRFYLGVTAAY